MATPDASLGINVAFPEADFVNGIRFAMQMGRHPDPNRALYFIRKVPGVTYFRDGVELVDVPDLDRDGAPLDPTVEVRRQADQIVRVDYAVEVTETTRGFVDTGVGIIKPTKITITLLGPDYAQVKDLRECSYNGDRFIYSYEPEADGLFEVAIHQVVYVAKDDT